MKWVDDLCGKVVGVDTAPFIYYMQSHTNYVDILHPFFQSVADGKISIVTSVITLTELLVQPLRKGETKLAEQCREMLFHTSGLTTIDPSVEIMEEAAKLRALYNIRAGDAIQLATAIKASASCFLTNDRQLQRASTIPVLVLDDLK
jgi:predicted nucleic acid-binding protein